MSNFHSIPKGLKITVISGAGISHPSGVPTFRGKDGLWKQYKAQDLATPSAFARDPFLVWSWYHWRINLISKANPNGAHLILAELEKEGIDIEILTQNVDNLQEKAGSKRVTHLHGEIMRTICIDCGTIGLIDQTYLNEKKPIYIPKCRKCDGKLRPKVVWFGETLTRETLVSSYRRLEATDLLIIAGTSAVVYPVAKFPKYAKQKNPKLKIIEFNLEKTPLSEIATRTILGSIDKTLNDFFINFGENYNQIT